MNGETVGYLVVDKNTLSLDWDGELHATRKDAIDSLCASRWGSTPAFTRLPSGGTDDQPYWGDLYIICTVTKEF